MSTPSSLATDLLRRLAFGSPAVEGKKISFSGQVLGALSDHTIP